MTESAIALRVVEETPAYWRVVFDYPPFNMVDATICLSTWWTRLSSKASRICSREWTPDQASVSWYSKARILTSTLHTLI